MRIKKKNEEIANGKNDMTRERDGSESGTNILLSVQYLWSQYVLRFILRDEQHDIHLPVQAAL